MSGVIDSEGQWEHCSKCGDWVLIQNLKYEEPSEEYPYGRDLCPKCAGELGVTRPGVSYRIGIIPDKPDLTVGSERSETGHFLVSVEDAREKWLPNYPAFGKLGLEKFVNGNWLEWSKTEDKHELLSAMDMVSGDPDK
jgi:hypothetical protein